MEKITPGSPPQGSPAVQVPSECVTLSGDAAKPPQGAKVRKSHSGIQYRDWRHETESLFQHFQGLKDDPHASRTAKLVIGVLGAEPFLGGPRDSLVERSWKYLQPREDFLPALRFAADHHVTKNVQDAIDVAQQMFDAIPMSWERPMDKAYAGIRMELAIAGMMGTVRPAETSEEFFMSPLANLKDDGQSPALAQVTIMQVKKDFDKLRELAKEFDTTGEAPVSPAKKIVVKEKTVEIGGVRLAIRKE